MNSPDRMGNVWSRARSMGLARAGSVVKAAIALAVLVVLLSAAAAGAVTVAAQPCMECGNASLVINGDVVSADGVRSSYRRNTVAYAPVALLARAVGGNDAQIGPYLSFEGGERYDPAGGGDCPACRLYATKVGGCSACRMEVVRTGLISGNIQWADGWYFALPDLAEALGGTLTWNADQSVYTITVPEGRCSTCLLRYRGVSAGGLPGMPMTGGAGGEWVLLVPLMVVVVGVCVVRCSGRLRGRW
jgi:hypothetical protein